MDRQILTPHVRQGSYTRAFGISVAGHALLLLLLVLGAELLPAGAVIEFGTGPGGGQGGQFITVGLTAELSGGAGMYKPAIVPRPTAVPLPPPRKDPEAVEPPKPDPNVFLEKEKNRRRAAERSRVSEKTKEQAEPLPGQIPTTPEPGAGGVGGQSAGAGGGFGGGSGVLIGIGNSAPGVIDSWYIRQVEQRIGANWLKTSLGELGQPVQSIVSFEVETGGTIAKITLEKRSGISAVDRAAERAVRASNPLPPLPLELRGRRVRFAAHFDYPQR